MPTSLTFTPEQITEITNLAVTANALRASDPSAVGVFAPLYERVIEMIEERMVAQGLENDSNVQDSLAWFEGAINVNNDVGSFNTLIRQYNKRQGQLWFDKTFSEDELQTASNAVGTLVAQQILAGNLPTVQEIGERDLAGLLETIYNVDGLNI